MPGHVLIAFSESPPGEYLMVEKRHLEAEALLARGYTGMKSTLSNRDLRVVEGRQRMVTFYDLWPHAIAK
jgi:hypothetical protein